VPENEAEREQIRRELLMGHLLALAASGGNGAVPPHALPAVAAMLHVRHRWVACVPLPFGFAARRWVMHWRLSAAVV
jgi:hypothetical protein